MSMKRIAVMLFAGVIASAQVVEFGGSIARGYFNNTGDGSGLGQAGVEACVACSGSKALFAEYTHWFSGGNGVGVPPISFSADFGAAGLRLQGTGGVRPFFDIGLAVGRDQHFRGGGGGLGGIVLGAGVRIPLGKHWYVRPQVRFYGLAGKDAGHQAFSAGAGIGYRF